MCPIAHAAWLLFIRDHIPECKDSFLQIILDSTSPNDWHGIPLLSSRLPVLVIHSKSNPPNAHARHSLIVMSHVLSCVDSSPPTTRHNESTHTEVHPKFHRMEYKKQLNGMKRAYHDIGLEGDEGPSKFTSAGRHQAANTLINGRGGQGGVKNAVAERLCNWTGKPKGTMDRYYADLPEVEGLASMAGHEAGGPGDYKIHRANIEPPPNILAQIWPELPNKIVEVIELRNKHKSEDDPLRPTDSNLEILKVLNCFRRTFLKDVPFLMECHPEHPTWTKHRLFQSEEFKAWKQQVLDFVQESHAKGVDHNGKVLIPRCPCIINFTSPSYSTSDAKAVLVLDSYGKRLRPFTNRNKLKLWQDNTRQTQ